MTMKSLGYTVVFVVSRSDIPGLYTTIKMVLRDVHKVLWCLLAVYSSTVFAELCDVTTGQTVIILDITESDGSQVDQLTSPSELPIEGQIGVETDLEISPEGKEYFTLSEGRLHLVQALDRDANDLSTLRFQLLCTIKSSGEVRNIPVIVRITDINDNKPVFSGLPYAITIPEITPVGTTVFKNVLADDMDAGVNGQVDYSIIPGNTNPESDGFGFFSITLPHQGLVSINRSLDYERTPVYYVTIQAMDRAATADQRLSSTATLTVNVADSDDQDPVFEYASCARVGTICANPEYHTTVTSGEVSGVLGIQPERIHAMDLDSLASPIRYSFMSGRPATYDRYFAINPRTGAVTHIAAIDRAVTKKFEIVLKAEEESEAKRFATAKLIIDVMSVDSSPPMVTATSYTGNVDENAAPGTPVYDDYPEPRPIMLTVSDPDLMETDDKPVYSWELTTTAFRVAPDGRLVVAESSLDRDPPNPGLYTFQIVARETKGNKAASAPITLTVVLNDVNDNEPRLPVYPPISVQAGSAFRNIAKITAKDNDAGKNAEIEYSIHQVSKNGKDKFTINGTSGELALVGEVDAGAQYSVTVRATDKGGLFSQSIIDVIVNRGPNKGGPVFTLPRYSASVSEGTPPNSVILTLSAIDPEGDQARFSLVSGNELRHFDIGETSGMLRLVDKLDRESLDAYSLVVKAEDPEGLANTATVSITVGDINDQSPEFLGLPYSFRVNEGQENAVVGTVKAEDGDQGVRGEVFYYVPEDSPFTIASDTGEIRTKQALNYEKEQVHYLVVTAKDGATDPHIATATVTVLVSDVGDEPPVFSQQVYEASVAENVPDALLAIVSATDPDTIPEITYVLVNGSSLLFNIDPESGRVTTARGLDYEVQSQHTIVIGTLENPSGGPQATCSVLVTVEDANDNPPVFNDQLLSFTIPDAKPPGSLIATVTAVDSDGTQPNNVVEYELTGFDNALEYFEVNKESGDITIKADLQAEPESDFTLQLVARDGGEPQLETTSTISIFVERPVPEETSEELYAAFSSDKFTAAVSEELEVGMLVKKLTVLNKPDIQRHLRCEITEGNDLGIFEMYVTAERHCAIKLKTPLDYESRSNYSLTVLLKSPSAPSNITNRVAKVEISVTDANDNKPEIFADSPYNNRTHGYFAFISEDSPVNTPVIRFKAEDKDSFSNTIHYELVPESNRGGYFRIDSTGRIKTDRKLTGVPSELLPFNLTVIAKDNPHNSSSVPLTTSASVTVNVVGENHHIVLVIDESPEKVKGIQEDLAKVIEEDSNHIIKIERIEPRKYIGNGTIERDDGATDVWFIAADSNSGRLIDWKQSDLGELFSNSSSESASVVNLINEKLGLQATDIRSPVLLQPVVETVAPPVRPVVTLEAFQIGLIVLAGIIVVLGIIGICYICFQWKRYVRHRDEASKAVVVVAPPYERVGSIIEPAAKEYEVQVLHMSVPMDDDSVQDLPIDIRPSHHFSMDNVSYITKQQLSEDESSNSSRDLDIDLGRPHHPHDEPVGIDWDSPPGQRHLQHMAAMAASSPSGRNPAYEHFADDDDGGDGPISVSATNENVMFGRRGILDPSPVQTTTEL
ncbi:cadherin-99C isoform X2 [Macrobrachium rosenbergii]|uniref:cadherin-99C isoform X2 n=1 Tax=Macrobrachium rosenbergii TaxID=79674 RepID=UPI0034D3C271